MINLWRSSPVISPFSLEYSFNRKHLDEVFPSGRQALSYCLQHAGLTRKDKVVIPEWSSHCVISAVGRVATPISIVEALCDPGGVSAIVIYDQWGWPVFDNCKREVEKIFKNKVIILDMVDSIHLAHDKSSINYQTNNLYRIFSLSKTLGLDGGGLVKFNKQSLSPSNVNKSIQKLIHKFEKIPINSECEKIFFKDFMKSSTPFLQKSLLNWLNNNSLILALIKEKESRKKNIKFLLSSGLLNDWPSWLKKSISDGAAPGIAPIFPNKNIKELNIIRKNLQLKFQISVEVYNFNWSDSIFNSDYQPCIAFPIHGEVKCIDKIVNWLKEA